MAGTFLLTFDCEGKWGVVDKLPASRQQWHTTARLEATYQSVLALLQKYRIGATFAFTAAFSMSPREFERMRPEIEHCGAAAAPWMRQALIGIERDDGNGWFSPTCFSAAREAGIHEIASHSFSHIPWKAPYATREILDAELALNRQAPGFTNAVETFVYPRNQVAHTDLLPLHGFHSFREVRPSLGRPANLMREFNFFSPSEQLGPLGPLPVAIPAGFFLNSRYGVRRCIPVALTVARWKHILQHAARNGGVVHAWTHPEDFIDGHSMFSQLDELLHLIADEREAGRLRIVTCGELVRLAVTTPVGVQPPQSSGLRSNCP